MNSVFNHFGVCDDVADKISRDIHFSLQKEVNEELCEMMEYGYEFCIHRESLINCGLWPPSEVDIGNIYQYMRQK